MRTSELLSAINVGMHEGKSFGDVLRTLGVDVNVRTEEGQSLTDILAGSKYIEPRAKAFILTGFLFENGNAFRCSGSHDLSNIIKNVFQIIDKDCLVSCVEAILSASDFDPNVLIDEKFIAENIYNSRMFLGEEKADELIKRFIDDRSLNYALVNKWGKNFGEFLLANNKIKLFIELAKNGGVVWANITYIRTIVNAISRGDCNYDDISELFDLIPSEIKDLSNSTNVFNFFNSISKDKGIIGYIKIYIEKLLPCQLDRGEFVCGLLGYILSNERYNVADKEIMFRSVLEIIPLGVMLEALKGKRGKVNEILKMFPEIIKEHGFIPVQYFDVRELSSMISMFEEGNNFVSFLEDKGLLVNGIEDVKYLINKILERGAVYLPEQEVAFLKSIILDNKDNCLEVAHLIFGKVFGNIHFSNVAKHKLFNAFIDSGQSPNIIINNRLLLENLLLPFLSIGPLFFKDEDRALVARVFAMHELDIHALSPTSRKSIIEILLDIGDLDFLFELSQIRPGFLDGVGLNVVAAKGNHLKKLESFVGLLDSITSLDLDSKEKARSFFESIKNFSMLHKNYSTKDLLLNVLMKLLPRQTNQSEFVKGLISFLLDNAYCYSIEPKAIFHSLLRINTLPEIVAYIGGEDSELNNRLMRNLRLFFESINSIPEVSRRYLEDRFDRYISDGGEWLLSRGKALHLLLGLTGNIRGFGSVEGGNPRDNAMYLRDLLLEVDRGLLSGTSISTEYLREKLARSVCYSETLAYGRLDHFRTSYIITKMLDDARTVGTLMLTGWPEHAIDIWIKGEFLYKCNGGGCSTDSTIEVYRIGNPDSLTIDLLDHISTKIYEEGNKDLIQKDLHRILGLTLICKNTWLFQRAGNCSLHSTLLGVQAIIASAICDAEDVDVDEDILVRAGVMVTNITQELKYHGIVINRREHPDNAKLLLSKLISLSHGDEAEKDRELIHRLLLESHLVLDENTLIAQMYEVFLMECKKSEDVVEFKEFLKSINLYPFEVSPFSGDKSRDFLKIMLATDEVLEISDDEIIKLKDLPMLHMAVRSGNIALVSRILTLLPDLIQRIDTNNVAPIGYARDIAMLDFLLGRGAVVEWGTQYYENCLYKLVAWASFEMISRVLAAGAKISPEALMFSPYNDDVRVMELLLDSEPYVLKKKTHSRRNLLHVAAKLGKMDHLRYLLSRADVRVLSPDVNGRTPLFDAVVAGRLEAATLLGVHPQTGTILPYRGDLLTSGHAGITESLCVELEHARQEKEESLAYFRDEFTKRSDLTLISEEAKSNPVVWFVVAIKNNDIKAFKGAMQCYPEIDINAYDPFFADTALHTAIQYDVSIEFIREIASLPGVKLDGVNGGGETLAQIAAIRNNRDILHVLHEIGAPMNTPDEIGVTPLMDAAERGCLEAVRFLTSIPDLDSNYKGFRRKDALDMVYESTSVRCFGETKSEIIRLIEEHQIALGSAAAAGAGTGACARRSSFPALTRPA